MSTRSVVDAFDNEPVLGQRVSVLLAGAAGGRVAEEASEAMRGRPVFVLHDVNEVRRHVDEIADEVNATRWRPLVAAAIRQLTSFSVTAPDTTTSYDISLFSGLTARATNLPAMYVLNRDSLDRETLSSFITLFEKVRPESRPKIVFDAEGNSVAAADLLSVVTSSVTTYVDSPQGLRRRELTQAAALPATFEELYLANAMEACARTEFPHISGRETESERRALLTGLYLKIQAIKRSNDKSAAAPDHARLVSHLTEVLRSDSVIEREWYENLLFFALLDDGYINESGGHAIERASAIAFRSGHPWLIAHAHRMINFTSGISPFSSAKLSEGASLFASMGNQIGEAYCLNNLLVTDSHRGGTPLDTAGADALVEFALRSIEYSDGVSSICSTAGVTMLLANRFDRAIELFDLASRSSGHRLHQLTGQVNALIAECAWRGDVDLDRVKQCADAIVAARLSRRLDYHHVYLLGNLMRMMKSKAEKKRFHEYLIDQAFFSYSKKVVRKDKLLEFLIPHFQSITDGVRYKGHRGEFFERTGLLPINHFLWN